MSNDAFINKAREDLEKKAILRAKEEAVRQRRIESDYGKLEEADRQEEAYRSVDLSKMDRNILNQIQEQSENYLRAVKKSLVFIDNSLKGIFPLHSQNVLLIGAASGEGKSTISANLTLSALKQSAKVLVLTNEENMGDIYNRVTCLIKGWNYQGHEHFTDDQIKEFRAMQEKLSTRMVVLGDRSVNQKEGGDTTTIEGLEKILTSLISTEEKYDLIILDYFQNVSSSKKAPNSSAWEVQAKLANFLDDFKNRYSAPVIVLAQIRPARADADIPFEDRIKGRKRIYETATFACEVRANKAGSFTEWVIHKSRFGVTQNGEGIKTGWEKGKYVPYTAEFQRRIEQRKMMSLIGTDGDKNGTPTEG